MAKYSDFIELSPHYESVVDIDSEKRYPNMWEEYIVHEDMQKAMEKICDSLKFEDKDKRRSFWIHGAYGTGKSYAAIVLKHLFEDKPENIRKFLSNQLLINYRERFLSLREKGEYLVVWESGTSDVKGGTHLLMLMEKAIREKLHDKYGDHAYYGRNSLVKAAQKSISDNSVNWKAIFADEKYALDSMFDSLEDFRSAVKSGRMDAIKTVADIYRDKNWGFMNSIDDFKAWIADIIKGNHLENSGIIFIWDEFTTYLRNNPTDETLQPLSEFCKEQPFFMFLIVHKALDWLSQMGEAAYERITHRFHALDFHVSETAAYELIGSCIRGRKGTEGTWRDIQNQLMKGIKPHIGEIQGLVVKDNTEQIRSAVPIHPMTLKLLTVVAQHFAASQRTLFRFMKDPKHAEENVGFIHYIDNYGPDDWRWLTVDFLWDYFFRDGSDVHEYPAEANEAYQHFLKHREEIADENYMHAFKAALLLLAVDTSGHISNLYSKTVQGKISPTRQMLYKCFAGQLDRGDVDRYLANLQEIGLLSLEKKADGDVRFQIPYTGRADTFDVRKKKFMAEHSRHELFKKGGAFSSSIEDKLVDKNKASCKRMVVVACDEKTNSINLRFRDVEDELEKRPYKFGILAVTISDSSHFISMQDKIKEVAQQDTTGRMAVFLLKTPLTEEILDQWYTGKTHEELASDEGKSGDAERHGMEALQALEGWAGMAAGGEMMAVYGNQVFDPSHNLPAQMEKFMLNVVFSAAPEHIVPTVTAYSKGNSKNAKCGIDKSKGNSQVQNVENGLKQCGAWGKDGLPALASCDGNAGAKAIAAVAILLQEKFSDGSQIRMDSLWEELQKPPYGYYDSVACQYLLGFLLREYANGEYTYNGGNNNTWPLNAETMANMIDTMCKGKAVNQYLSSGSEAWRNFKEYLKRIFRLDDAQTVNETEARKFLAEKCAKYGVPLWALKYAEEDDFGGSAMKEKAVDMITLFDRFLNEDGDQEKILSDVVIGFRGAGTLRKTLESLYLKPEKMVSAFMRFLKEVCPELGALRADLKLKDQNVRDSMAGLLQGLVANWSEADVKEKAKELCVEYRTILALDRALNENSETLTGLAKILNHAFSHMKVPGTVIEGLGYEWIPALQAMYTIARQEWVRLTPSQKEDIANALEKHGAIAWGSVNQSKAILADYLAELQVQCSEAELESIYGDLELVTYGTTTGDFQSRINRLLEHVDYNRNKKKLQELWEEQSGGKETVREWCNAYCVPIHWVVNDESRPHIDVVKSIQDREEVSNDKLRNAVAYLKTHDLSVLRDFGAIQEAFFAQIGDSYRDAFAKEGKTLRNRLKTSSNMTSDVYSWANKVGSIRKSLDDFLKGKYCTEAKQRVRTMPEKKLRECVLLLLENNPDLYNLFLK